MKKLIFFTLILSLFSATQASAASWLHPYIGIDYGYSKAGYGNYPSKAYEDKTDSYILSAGIKILPGLAIEGFYQKSGDENNTSSNVLFAGDYIKSRMNLQAYGVDAVSNFLNLGLVEVLGSVGIAKYDVKASQDYYFNQTLGHTSKTYSGEGLRFGLGAQLNLNETYSIRAMGRYSFTNIEKINDFKEFTIGLRYNF